MARYPWLADVDQQKRVYEMTYNGLSAIRPEELPYLDDLFADYVELAQEGDVSVGPEMAYGFGGTEDLWALVVIPLALNLFNTVVAQRLSDRSEQRDKTTLTPAELAQIVRVAVAQITWLTPNQRRELEGCFTEVLQRVIEEI